MTLRRATADDVPALVPLFDGYRRFYGHASDAEGADAFLRARLARGEAVVFVAEADGQAVGFTLLYPSFSSVRMAPLWVLNDLFVAPGARTRGVGRALLDAAHAFAAGTGACAVALATGHDNAAAQRLYDAAGFVRDAVYLYERPVPPPAAG